MSPLKSAATTIALRASIVPSTNSGKGVRLPVLLADEHVQRRLLEAVLARSIRGELFAPARHDVVAAVAVEIGYGEHEIDPAETGLGGDPRKADAGSALCVSRGAADQDRRGNRRKPSEPPSCHRFTPESAARRMATGAVHPEPRSRRGRARRRRSPDTSPAAATARRWRTASGSPGIPRHRLPTLRRRRRQMRPQQPPRAHVSTVRGGPPIAPQELAVAPPLILRRARSRPGGRSSAQAPTGRA